MPNGFMLSNDNKLIPAEPPDDNYGAIPKCLPPSCILHKYKRMHSWDYVETNSNHR